VLERARNVAGRLARSVGAGDQKPELGLSGAAHDVFPDAPRRRGSDGDATALDVDPCRRWPNFARIGPDRRGPLSRGATLQQTIKKEKALSLAHGV